MQATCAKLHFCGLPVLQSWRDLYRTEPEWSTSSFTLDPVINPDLSRRRTPARQATRLIYLSNLSKRDVSQKNGPKSISNPTPESNKNAVL